MTEEEQWMHATGHRPLPMPPGKWAMQQQWHDVLMAHWPVDAETIQAQLPPSLEVDVRDGQAWVTLIPFRIAEMRLRDKPMVASFLELNVRTYVRHNGVPGIFFFSLEASNRFVVEAARMGHIPYVRAQMKMERHADGTISYRSERRDPRAAPAQFEAQFRANADVFHAEEGTLAHWLAERYRMYAVSPDHDVYHVDIHHEAWPLQLAEVAVTSNSMLDAQGIPLPPQPALATYSRYVHALLWPLRPSD